MGQNHGRVISVTDQKIELTEIISDALGNYIEHSSAIALTQ
jgi:Tfp pilus assembly protein PilP